MTELAFSVFLESGSIAIAFRHPATVADTAEFHCTVSHTPVNRDEAVAALPDLLNRDE